MQCTPGNTYHEHMSNVSMVHKIFDRSTSKHVADIVFMIVYSPEISREAFHGVIVDNFDIAICTLAWDGTKLYLPPIKLANLQTKTSKMKCSTKRTLDKLAARSVGNVANLIGFSVLTDFDRLLKYHNRGFTIEPEIL